MKELMMLNVKSSQLKSIGYDVEKEELYIEFISGKVYKYFYVPKDVYEKLISLSSSAGTYFHSNIRLKYNYELTFYKVENQSIKLP